MALSSVRFLVAIAFVVKLAVVVRAEAGLRIGSWKITTFGPTKLARNTTINYIVTVLRRYDAVLVMEIRDSKMRVVPKTLEKLNAADGAGAWQARQSERLGRTRYKEQYAIFFRTSKLTVVQEYQFDDGPNDGADWFEREPYGILFDAPTTEVQRFAMIGLHADPDAVTLEIGHLEDVRVNVSDALGTESVFILVNAACTNSTQSVLETITQPSDQLLISDDADTAVSESVDCAYDRIIAYGNLSELVNRTTAGVYTFSTPLGLNETEAAKLSDSYPVEVELLLKEITTTTTQEHTTSSGTVRERTSSDTAQESTTTTHAQGHITSSGTIQESSSNAGTRQASTTVIPQVSANPQLIAKTPGPAAPCWKKGRNGSDSTTVTGNLVVIVLSFLFARN